MRTLEDILMFVWILRQIVTAGLRVIAVVLIITDFIVAVTDNDFRERLIRPLFGEPYRRLREGGLLR